MEDSQPKALLTDRTLNSEIIYSKKIIDLTDEEIFKQWSSENLKVVNKLEDLIYIIYTSGTTGKPKGVKANQKIFLIWLWLIKRIWINSRRYHITVCFTII